MSAPNKDFDPVEVTPLRADEVERMRDEALSAIAAADSLEVLKQVRLDHAGSQIARRSSRLSTRPRRLQRRPSTSLCRGTPSPAEPATP
jgi:hypothetical protein